MFENKRLSCRAFPVWIEVKKNPGNLSSKAFIRVGWLAYVELLSYGKEVDKNNWLLSETKALGGIWTPESSNRVPCFNVHGTVTAFVSIKRK